MEIRTSAPGRPSANATRSTERLGFARIELTAVVRRALDVVQDRLAKRNQEVSVSLPSAPCYVRGNPARLEQAFANLLANASRFSKPGSRIWLSVDAIATSEHTGQVRMRVRDEGIGITASRLTGIFERGLTLVQHIVEQHGGHVRARSDGEHYGSEFTVMLPLLETPLIPYRLQA